MDLGSVEYNDPKNCGLKTTSLVLAFQPVARRVVDKQGGFLEQDEFHYEPSDETNITVGGKADIGQYGGELTRNIRVPFRYDDVKLLLAEGAKKGETVDFTQENIPHLRARLKKDPGSRKLSL
jgi:hypothetical protein